MPPQIKGTRVPLDVPSVGGNKNMKADSDPEDSRTFEQENAEPVPRPTSDHTPGKKGQPGSDVNMSGTQLESTKMRE